MNKPTTYILLFILAFVLLIFVTRSGCGDSIFGLAVLGVIFVSMMACSSEPQTFRTGGITGGAAKEKLSIFDPRFNMREIAKHLILLEDHLFHENKHCIDCISKHFLTVEAFAEETLTLDKEMQYGDEVKEVLKVKEIMSPLIEKMKAKKATPQEYSEAAQALRKIRKPIAVKYGFLQ